MVLANQPEVEKRPRTGTPHSLTLSAGLRKEAPPLATSSSTARV